MIEEALDSRQFSFTHTMDSVHRSLPFSKVHQLCDDLDSYEDDSARNDVASSLVTLPGQPCIALTDREAVKQFLTTELYAQDLEIIAPCLWIMSTQSSANINPLHRQRVRGREIIVTEDPRLHLVWFHNKIFIKPLPKYLLSHKFWNLFLLDNSRRLGSHEDLLRKAAMGYLRTYRYLIQHESDFVIAKQDHLRLVPENVGWDEFCRFISGFNLVKDIDVSGRYCYGELRLSRLNFYAPLLLRKFKFEHIHGQYSDYFARFYGPLLFTFAIVSIALNSMQVNLAIDQVSKAHWVALWFISRWFSGLTLGFTALISLYFVFLWCWMIANEWVFAIECRLRKKRELRYQSTC